MHKLPRPSETFGVFPSRPFGQMDRMYGKTRLRQNSARRSPVASSASIKTSDGISQTVFRQHLGGCREFVPGEGITTVHRSRGQQTSILFAIRVERVVMARSIEEGTFEQFHQGKIEPG